MPSRSKATVWNGDANTRTFLPLKSVRLRSSVLLMSAFGVAYHTLGACTLLARKPEHQPPRGRIGCDASPNSNGDKLSVPLALACYSLSDAARAIAVFTWYTNPMLRRATVFLIAFLAAAGTAVALYVIGHDDIGIARHAMITDSFVSAAGLATLCVVATIAKRRK
jgi:hypothetical protein